MKRQKTKTSTFGVSRREGHDASLYYSRSLVHAEIDDYTETNEPLPEALGLHVGDSRDMGILHDNSVGLMVTSPPYHAAKDYDTDDTLEQYLMMLEDVFTETYRVLEPGGRAVVNVAGLGRRPYVPLPDLVSSLMHDIGYHHRGEVIWLKGKGASGSCAWGTFGKADNPVFRDIHEYFLCFSKGRFDRPKTRRGTSTITKEDFLECTLSVWNVRPESAKRVGHPAPFPIEIPRRFIELYSYKEDVVLDPFMGAGSTAVAAIRTGRRFVGWDLDPAYTAIAQRRVDAEMLTLTNQLEAS